MVGHHQAVRRHKGRGAPWNAQGRQASLVEPTLIRLETVGFGEVVHGSVFEGPHLSHVETPGLGFVTDGPGALGGHGLGNGDQEEWDEKGDPENPASDGMPAALFLGKQTGQHHIFPTLLK
jgi:hypothetical protein